MTNLDSIFKSRDITLPTKVCLVKAMVFPVVMYGCESWTVKKAEHWRFDAFELWCWRRLLRVPWTGRRSNQSILKEIRPEYSLEGLILKLKLQYFGHLMQRTDSLEKTLMLDDWRQEMGTTEGDGWMASLTQCTWVCASSGSWWWTGKPGVLQSVGPQRGGHDWATQLNTLWGATRNSREDRQKERRKASENLFSMSKSGRQRSFWIPNKISEVKGTDQTTYHFYFHVEGSFSILDPQNPDSPSIIQPVTSPVNLTSLSLESTHPPPSP